MRFSHWRHTPGPGAFERHVWASACVACGALVVALGLGTPADAANSYGPHATTLDAHPHVASPVPPLNLAIVTVTSDSTGATTMVKTHQVQPNTSSGCQSYANSTCLAFSDAQNPEDPGLFVFGSITGPGVYSGGGGNGRVTAGGTTCIGTGHSLTVEVDQYQVSGGTEQAAAIQFDCNDGFNDISGTIAYNIVPTDPGDGYYIFGQEGELAAFGNDNYLVYLDGADDYTLNAPIVGMAATPDGGGYWMVGSDGGVYASGDAQFYGSTGTLRLNKPVVGMAATHDGGGYWFVASDGGIFSYGDAQFYGSTGGMPLNQPIVGMAPTPSGRGYWLVAADGGIFAYGDAQFYGSTGGMPLNKPIVGMAPTPSGRGYWLVASDGGIFAYGDAQFYGSTGALHLNAPIVGMVPTLDGGGYWFVASDGGVFNYGNAPFAGSLGGAGINDVAGLTLGGRPASI